MLNIINEISDFETDGMNSILTLGHNFRSSPFHVLDKYSLTIQLRIDFFFFSKGLTSTFKTS